MGKRRFKGHDPAAKARQDYDTRRTPALWGVNEEARQLPKNADVQSTPETRTTTRRVQRFDVFATIKLSDHSFNAVRRYHHDLATSFGCGDGGESLPPGVDATGSRELVTTASLAASKRVMALYDLLALGDRRLLYALSYPVWVEGAAVNWKAVVADICGCIDKDTQAQAVRDLGAAVVEAYRFVDSGQRLAA